MKPFYSRDFRLGVLGGGQLGRMLIQEAISLDVRVCVLDPDPESSCSAIAHEYVRGDFADYDAVVAFGRSVDVLTIEIEHVNVDALEQLKREGRVVVPDPPFLRMIRDKGLQKEFYHRHGIPTAAFSLVLNREELKQVTDSFPVMQKLRLGGYDGKGVFPIRSEADLSGAFDAPSVVEEWVEVEKELSVILSRHRGGELAVFPLVEMAFNPEANLVEMLFSPASVPGELAARAEEIARHLAEQMDYVGLLAVEMILAKDGRLLVNEMAPRPHNSGHHTIEACGASQYGQHLRAVLGLPPSPDTYARPSAMINLLGAPGHTGPVVYEGLEEAVSLPGVYVHLYGKAETRPFRKMGHITVVRDAPEEARRVASQLQAQIRVISRS